MITDWVMVAAVILGPIGAIQVDRFLTGRRMARQRKLDIFRILMTTRAEGLSRDHVSALNSIDIEFHDTPSVTDAWKQYLDHLNTPPEGEGWAERRLEYLTDLLTAMAKRLGYKFDRVHIKRAVYNPQYYGDLEEDQIAIRRGMAALFKGKVPLLTASFPPSEEQKASTEREEKEQTELRHLLIDYYKSRQPVEVRLVPSETDGKSNRA